MSRYVDAEALIEQINSCSYETWSKDVNRAWWAQAVKVKDNIVECIKRQPTADVEEVRHGSWGFDGMGWTCSECGEYALTNKTKMQVHSAHCPHCGAKMDGERRSENEG